MIQTRIEKPRINVYVKRADFQGTDVGQTNSFRSRKAILRVFL